MSQEKRKYITVGRKAIDLAQLHGLNIDQAKEFLYKEAVDTLAMHGIAGDPNADCRLHVLEGYGDTDVSLVLTRPESDAEFESRISKIEAAKILAAEKKLLRLEAERARAEKQIMESEAKLKILKNGKG